MRYLHWKFWQEWSLHDSPHTILQSMLANHTIAKISELAALIGVPQDPMWHPEGDVWTHTVLVCEQAALIAKRAQLSDSDRTILLVSALCHDLGKATSTKLVDDRWRSPLHAEKGVALSQTFLSRVACPQSIIAQILPLVREHLVYASFDHVSPKIMKRLLSRLEPASFDLLALLIEADQSGRPPLQAKIPDKVLEMKKVLAKLSLEKSAPIISGKHLIEKGLIPGPAFQEILRTCAKAQEEGLISSLEQGLVYLDEILAKKV